MMLVMMRLFAREFPHIVLLMAPNLIAIVRSAALLGLLLRPARS